MENNMQMMNNNSIMTVVVSEKEFDSNLRFVSKIAEEAKNKGKSVLFRKVDSKLIMCSGGINSSVAMVPVDVEGDAGEWKGFVDGKDIIAKLSKSRSKNDRLEISIDKDKSCIFLTNERGELSIEIDFIEDVASAQSAEDIKAKYRNEIVERGYRVVRDVESLGKVQLKHKDFLDLEKSFTHAAYIIGGEKCIEFRAFTETQKVKRKVKDPNANNVEREIIVDENFAIAEGVGFENNRMGICRKYGLGIGFPEGVSEMRIMMSADLLNHVSSAIAAMKDEPVMISRGVSEMCVTAGKARFICPVKDIEIQDIRKFFGVSYDWKINVDAAELRDVVDLLSKCLDQDTKAVKVPVLNKMIIMPREKKILFSGVASNKLPVRRYIDYKMAVDANGIEYMDFNIDEFDLGLQRKYIREFLESCKSKEVSFGVHTYTSKRKKKGPNGMFEKDAQGNFVKEDYQGKLISMEDASQGIYGVHHRIKR